jgi:uncharacterized protein YaiI (UPF0178 family)
MTEEAVCGSVVVAIDVGLASEGVAKTAPAQSDRCAEYDDATDHHHKDGAGIYKISSHKREEGKEKCADALNPASGVVVLIPH